MNQTIHDQASNELSKLRRADCMYTGAQLAEIFRVAKLVRETE